MNPRLEHLHQYPFERLNALLSKVKPNPELAEILLSLGEPKHAPPGFILDYLADQGEMTRHLSTYPATKGIEQLRNSISRWLARRFGVTADPDTQILPVNGTREALFSIAQACLSGNTESLVLTPNPFYQIYEGAAILGGARPLYISNDPLNDYQQNFESIDTTTWQKTELVYICSPGNPTGQVMSQQQMIRLIELSEAFDFIIASDECYSEIYFDDKAPPGSLLAACKAMGNDLYKNCIIFHSLSKRSNLPGLRSGFVAGDAELLNTYLLYRTYHGCAMSAHHQVASCLAWDDEKHVEENRTLYRQKFEIVEKILAPTFDIKTPSGGFYHWLRVPGDDTVFAKDLMREMHVKVIPGQYLAPHDGHTNPGQSHIRIAWVSELAHCSEAAHRLVDFTRRR